MYDKHIESDTKNKRAHDEAQKQAAAKRLAKNAEYNKAHK
jgi:hypothetical protein